MNPNHEHREVILEVLRKTYWSIRHCREEFVCIELMRYTSSPLEEQVRGELHQWVKDGLQGCYTVRSFMRQHVSVEGLDPDVDADVRHYRLEWIKKMVTYFGGQIRGL